jgi:hypothetical protein
MGPRAVAGGSHAVGNHLVKEGYNVASFTHPVHCCRRLTATPQDRWYQRTHMRHCTILPALRRE